jgi:hypothetical protein
MEARRQYSSAVYLLSIGNSRLMSYLTWWNVSHSSRRARHCCWTRTNSLTELHSLSTNTQTHCIIHTPKSFSWEGIRSLPKTPAILRTAWLLTPASKMRTNYKQIQIDLATMLLIYPAEYIGNELPQVDNRQTCKIWGFHGGDYEEWCLLGCYAVLILYEPTFRRNLAPPSSGCQESVN